MSKFVICIDNDNYQASLELFKVYITLPDDKGEKKNLIRVVDESGEDYLYPQDMFAQVNLPEVVAQVMLKVSNGVN